MADNILTPEFRAAYISVFKAKSFEEGGKKTFSVKAMFPPTTDMTALKAAAGAAAVAKWGDKIPKLLASPFRNNEDLENPVPGLGQGEDGDWIVMTFAANEDRKPGLVDHLLQDIINEEEVYAGAWYRAQVRAYGYEFAGKKGVSFGLQNLQKLREGDPLGGGRTPANRAFEAVGGAAKTAGSMFD